MKAVLHLNHKQATSMLQIKADFHFREFQFSYCNPQNFERCKFAMPKLHIFSDLMSKFAMNFKNKRGGKPA